MRVAGTSLAIIACLGWGAAGLCEMDGTLLPFLAALVVVGILRTGRQAWALHRNSAPHTRAPAIAVPVEVALFAFMVAALAGGC